ncbi:MAG: carbohydrate ABC transporter permease [Butyrivibrio sp.]|uniref:carbohydrate ABC transporter permease n=1 Tax=Butyrivibrio sp. TaxID=28121 RepID=UPI001B1DBC39|nr:carbohydrate ABC transporter permease [Butyrivibrio sp.]MBO6241767.1 carbohydrate ABC transporter permease [Butyrivibrio sp.]
MITNKKSFKIFVNVILSLLALFSVLPIFLVFMASITEEQTLILNGYSFVPQVFSLYAYKYILFSGNVILRAYLITISVTAIGTFVNLFLTTFLAYPLSKKDLKGRNIILFMVFFTMLFNGGLVSSYMMWTQIFHIRDTYFALLVPNLMMNAFNVIIMKNFFVNNIPESLLEAAKLDGATELQILNKVVFPLSKPIIATVGMMVGLAYWNDWQNGLYFLLMKTNLYGIQNVLNTMINNVQFLSTQAASQGGAAAGSLPSTGIRMAIAVIALAPVIIIYPFVQKAFVKGIVVGGVKG